MSNQPCVFLKDRDKDQDLLHELSLHLGKGITALAVMYDDHSLDKNASENILRLKENITYRLNSIINQHAIFIYFLEERSKCDR